MTHRRPTGAAITMLLTLMITGGCIRRYAAPEDLEDPVTPYSALAALQRITPPAGPVGAPLPKAALRLALGPSGWLADSSLVDGAAARVIDGPGLGWPSLELLGRRPEPVVVLLDASLLGDPAICELLAALGERAVLATGRAAFGPNPAPKRSDEGDSADPLGGVSAAQACGGSEFL